MIESLQTHLALEISASDRHNAHCQLLGFWGYAKLADRYREAAAEERSHANVVMQRILQLGSIPEYLPAPAVKALGKRDIKVMLAGDLAMEERVLESLNKLLDKADDQQQDFGTFTALQPLVSATVEDIQWYTAQLGMIEEIGLQNYLASMM